MKKYSTGDAIAAEMASIMDSKEYKNIFAKPTPQFQKTAAKKDEGKDDKKGAKAKDKAKACAKCKGKPCKCDTKAKAKKGKKCSKCGKKCIECKCKGCKECKVANLRTSINGLAKISEMLEELGLEKSAANTIIALDYLIKEAQQQISLPEQKIEGSGGLDIPKMPAAIKDVKPPGSAAADCNDDDDEDEDDEDEEDEKKKAKKDKKKDDEDEDDEDDDEDDKKKKDEDEDDEDEDDVDDLEAKLEAELGEDGDEEKDFDLEELEPEAEQGFKGFEDEDKDLPEDDDEDWMEEEKEEKHHPGRLDMVGPEWEDIGVGSRQRGKGISDLPGSFIGSEDPEVNQFELDPEEELKFGGLIEKLTKQGVADPKADGSRGNVLTKTAQTSGGDLTSPDYQIMYEDYQQEGKNVAAQLEQVKAVVAAVEGAKSQIQNSPQVKGDEAVSGAVNNFFSEANKVKAAVRAAPSGKGMHPKYMATLKTNLVKELGNLVSVLRGSLVQARSVKDDASAKGYEWVLQAVGPVQNALYTWTPAGIGAGEQSVARPMIDDVGEGGVYDEATRQTTWGTYPSSSQKGPEGLRQTLLGGGKIADPATQKRMKQMGYGIIPRDTQKPENTGYTAGPSPYLAGQQPTDLPPPGSIFDEPEEPEYESLMSGGSFDLAIDKITKLGAKEKAKKLDPKAKVRNRGKCVFPAESSKVTDHASHFPITSESQARNALARASQFKSVPPWYKGSLSGLVSAVQRAVKSKYPGIKTTEKSKNPKKGSLDEVLVALG